MKIKICPRCKNNKIQILSSSGLNGRVYNFICKCGQKGPVKNTYNYALKGWNLLNVQN